MVNDYYNEQFAGQEHGLARVGNVKASLRRVVAGFDKLPSEEQLKTDSTTSAVATGGPVNYSVELPFAPDSYVDQMRIGVRFPVANTGAANIEVIGANGVTLGFKPIRQIDGTPLTEGHIGANSEGLLQYSAVGSGHWTLMAGARGARGPAGPPDGTFSVNSDKELVFTPTGGGPGTNLGAIAPVFKGAYSATRAYGFLHVVREGTYLYLHVGLAETTGTGVSDTTVWQRITDPGNDGGMVVEFRTATSQGDPGDGRMRFNNATLASVTAIYLDDQDANGNDLSAWIDTWDDYGDDPHAQLVIKGTGGNIQAIVFNLTAVANLSGYKRLTVSHVAGGMLPSNGDLVSVVPLLRGDTGASGATLPDASESTKGKIEIADEDEADDGSDDSRAMTPAKVRRVTGARVSDDEKTAGTETAVRRFSPDDVADMIDRHASYGALADAASIAWDVRANPVGGATLAGNRRLANPINAENGGVYIFEAVQDATGNRTLDYDSEYSFGEEGTPVLSTGANKRDMLTFFRSNGKMELLGISKGH